MKKIKLIKKILLSMIIITILGLIAHGTVMAFLNPNDIFIKQIELGEQAYKAAQMNMNAATCSLANAKLLAFTNNALKLEPDEVKRLATVKAEKCKQDF
jgi:uncharacterized membrane protein